MLLECERRSAAGAGQAGDLRFGETGETDGLAGRCIGGGPTGGKAGDPVLDDRRANPAIGRKALCDGGGISAEICAAAGAANRVESNNNLRMDDLPNRSEERVVQADLPVNRQVRSGVGKR